MTKTEHQIKREISLAIGELGAPLSLIAAVDAWGGENDALILEMLKEWNTSGNIGLESGLAALNLPPAN